MKNKIFKVLWILLVPLLLSGCSNIIKSYSIDNAYGIIKDGKIDRMGVLRDDVYKMDEHIRDKYGIRFGSYFSIEAPIGIGKSYYINFYDEIIVIIKGQKYIIPKEDIEEYGIDDSGVLSSLDEGAEYSYKNGMPVGMSDLDYNNYILELGEIEIIDKEGKVVRERRKIPPILFKTTYHIATFKAFTGSFRLIYYGWAEDYSKD